MQINAHSCALMTSIERYNLCGMTKSLKVFFDTHEPYYVKNSSTRGKRLLDVWCGMERHGVRLAEQGYRLCELKF
jgi:hypothetical protein